MRRVAITGLGAICALGRTVPETAESLRAGRSGIGPIESTDMSQMRFQNGAEVRGYTHESYFDDRRADFIDRFAQFAVIAAREAVADAGILWTPELRETAAIVTGSCVGGQSTEDIGFQEVYKFENHGQRGREPHLNGVWHYRPQLHDFDRMFFGGTCDRAGVPDDSDRPDGSCPHRRQRGDVQLRHSQSVGSHARGFAGYVPAVLERPARHDSG
jgi:hypothetical protein